MKKLFFFAFFLCLFSISIAQPAAVARPKIVVGIMVDQMRWDFLYKYANRYGNNGFKRLLRDGFTCENTYIDYAQTVTACGHATVYTGTVPSVHGIMGNEWWDRSKRRQVYCTEDPSVKSVGPNAEAPPMSPRNLEVTTMCDELRIATNYKARVVGIAIKDRGGILPAGHAANAAYWYDGTTGSWISSNYYMSSLPEWVNAFNRRKMPDSLYGLNWNTLYPIESYTLSDADDKKYEGKFAADPGPVFPHILTSYKGKNYGILPGTPHGNTLSLEFAKTAIINEQMGADEVTDFLALSLSSPDYIGHQYGPNSIEIEDTYLRLDRELADFLKFLDTRFAGNYTVFLTADHGVAHSPGYSIENKLPGGALNAGNSQAMKNAAAKYGVNLVENYSNYQVYLNRRLIDSLKLDIREVKSYMVDQLNAEAGVHYAFDNEKIASAMVPSEIRERFINGMHPKLSGDIQVILKPGYLSWGTTGSSHGTWYPYDSHIPFVLMGWGINKGRLTRDVHMTDIAPTICSLLRIQMPSGNIGNVVSEALK